MVLFMPRPYKHPATGVYWFRQRVPARVSATAKGRVASVTVNGAVVRRTVGDTLTVSLATKDPAEAKVRAAAVQAQFDDLWASFANPPQVLTLREIVALAGEAFRAFQSMEDNPGTPERWRNVLEVNKAALDGGFPLVAFIGTPEERFLFGLQQRFGVFVDGILQVHHLRVDGATYRQLLVHVGRALAAAADLLLKRSEGDYSPDNRGERYPAVERGSIGKAKAEPSAGLSLFDLLDHKAKAKALRPDTASSYRSSLGDFAKFAKHSEAHRVTRDEVRRWRDQLQSRGLTPKTINDSYLAAIKSVLKHAVKEFDLPTNVAAEIRDERPAPPPKGSKDYTEEEAKAILSATFNGTAKAVSVPHQRALFWVPWICAYHGLRVSEVTQFRGRNLRMEGGIPTMLITPDDGSTKSKRAWAVAVHPHLIELGLIDMLQELGDGPAFYVPYPEGTDLTKIRNHRSKDAADRIAAWIKEEVGIKEPPGGRPSHAWRHLFTTRSRVHKLDKEARDYMLGSRPRTDAREGYGEWPPEALKPEVDRLPRFEVEATTWRPTNARVAASPQRGAANGRGRGTVRRKRRGGSKAAGSART
jgi:integrase